MSVRPEWVNRARTLGEKVAEGLNITLYVIFAEALDHCQVKYPDTHSGWLNLPLAVRENFPKTKHSPNNAHRKLGELIDGDPNLKEDEVLCTPVLSKEEGGTGWRGGVRIGNYIICASKLADGHDLLMVAMMFASTWTKGLAEFDRVMPHGDSPCVVLKSRTPDLTLNLIAKICGVQLDPLDMKGVKARKCVSVQRGPEDTYGPYEIMVAVEPLH